MMTFHDFLRTECEGLWPDDKNAVPGLSNVNPFARAEAESCNAHAGPEAREGGSEVEDRDNTGDTIMLIDPMGQVVDGVSYDAIGEGIEVVAQNQR